MKILYIITQADGGGAQKYVLMLAKHFEGAIAAGSEARQLFDEAKKLGIPTFELRHLKRNIHPWHDFWAIFEIKKLIKKHQPKIVHLNSTKAGFVGSIAGKLSGVKVIFTAHGFRFLEPLSALSRWFYLLIEKSVKRFRNYIIAVSDFDREMALEYNIIAENKISAIHNGLAPINFKEKSAARKALHIADDEIVGGSLSSFYKTKGLDVLIDAIAIMSKEAKNRCQFVLVGDGPELEDLRLKIKDLRLGDIVTLPGKIDNANKYLKAFDIFVLPSRKEGFPFALLEAMQAGLPIAATRVGGNAEALDDVAMLIKANDTQALADAIEILLTDEELRKTLSEKALERSKLFTEEKMLEETKKVYEKLV